MYLIQVLDKDDTSVHLVHRNLRFVSQTKVFPIVRQRFEKRSVQLSRGKFQRLPLSPISPSTVLPSFHLNSQRPTTSSSFHCQRTARGRNTELQAPRGNCQRSSKLCRRTTSKWTRCKSHSASPHLLSSQSPSRRRSSCARLEFCTASSPPMTDSRAASVDTGVSDMNGGRSTTCPCEMSWKAVPCIQVTRACPPEAPSAALEVPAPSNICSASTSRDGNFTSFTACMSRTKQLTNIHLDVLRTCRPSPSAGGWLLAPWSAIRGARLVEGGSPKPWTAATDIRSRRHHERSRRSLQQQALLLPPPAPSREANQPPFRVQLSKETRSRLSKNTFPRGAVVTRRVHRLLLALQWCAHNLHDVFEVRSVRSTSSCGMVRATCTISSMI